MSQEIKLDYIPIPETYVPFKKAEIAEIRQVDKWRGIINSIIRAKELRHFNGFVVGFVTFAYFRINATRDVNKLHIPVNALLDTLAYHEDQNFFIEIFNRFKIICESNAVLGETASILEHIFMLGAEKLSSEFQENIAKEFPQIDWSERGIDIQYCSYYVKDILVWENIVYVDDPTDYQDFYQELHHFTPLLNILPEEKQLCTPILYITYLINILEQTGWPDNCYEKLVNVCLGNVTTIQVNRVLWAIHTLEIVLLGSSEQPILREDGLTKIYSNIHNKIENGYDVIFLPEVNFDTIPDVGPIIIDDIEINKVNADDWYSNDIYTLAFLYALLNDNGRMLVRFSKDAEDSLSRDRYNDHPYNTDKILAYFVHNDLIRTVIQIKNATYILIDKNKAVSNHGKILFYYDENIDYIPECIFPSNERLEKCIKEFSCEDIHIKHDEGACIVSNREIEINNYCLLPKYYVYDFNRVKQQVEFDMIEHIRHEANPRISNIEISLKYLGKFLHKNGLDAEPYQEKLDENDDVPSIKDVIDGCRKDLLRLQTVFSVTREVVLESFDKSNFVLCDLNQLFADISNSQVDKKYTIEVVGSVKSSSMIYENAFRDMIENIIRNAEEHGFSGDRTDYRIVFDLSQSHNDRRIIIKCFNNGEPLPANFTKEKLFSKGVKGVNSPGMGLGGERISKILAAHNAGFDVLPIGNLPQGLTVGFEITLAVERNTNEQG